MGIYNAPNTFVLLAYYAGEDVGYSVVMGWLSKQVIKPDMKKKDDYIMSYSYFSEIDVNNPDNNYKRQKITILLNTKKIT